MWGLLAKHPSDLCLYRVVLALLLAGMRQLWSMGWCHNRVRVVASHFMVKHLLLPWQWGLKHLWDCQIDADLECDALGWQYVSGCLSGACCVLVLGGEFCTAAAGHACVSPESCRPVCTA
jgi:hypothetical protein